MNRRRSFIALLTFGLVLTVAACGGKKRPPALTTAGGEGTSGRRSAPPPPVEEGPDLRPVEGESTFGEDFPPSDPSGEGGPLADIHFEFDQAGLTNQARATLEKHALWLQNHREARVTVEGHCDERGTVDYNLALGDKRAQAARDYLVSLGVAPERLRTVSYGKERPLDSSGNEQAWTKNRRAHFAVSR